MKASWVSKANSHCFEAFVLILGMPLHRILSLVERLRWHQQCCQSCCVFDNASVDRPALLDSAPCSHLTKVLGRLKVVMDCWLHQTVGAYIGIDPTSHFRRLLKPSRPLSHWVSADWRMQSSRRYRYACDDIDQVRLLAVHSHSPRYSLQV